MNYDFFISHSEQVKYNFAIPLEQILVSMGFSVWIDKKSIFSGDPIYEKIKSAISMSDFCIALIDSNFLQKTWPIEELRLFHDKEDIECTKVIIPIFINVDSKSVFDKIPWLKERAFEKIETNEFNTYQNIDVLCRIMSKFCTDNTTHNIDTIMTKIMEYDFNSKLMLKKLYNTRNIYCDSTTTISILDLCNINSLMYGIIKAFVSPNAFSDKSVKFTNLLRDICFDTTFMFSYNMYTAVLYATILMAEQLESILNKINNSNNCGN